MFSYFTLNNLWTLIQQLLDILCVWALVYYCLKIVKNNSRTIQIFKGILLIMIIQVIATRVGLHTIANLTTSVMSWGIVAVIIIFQPEIRNILEKIGKTSVFSRISTLTLNERENLVDELVKSCSEMSKTKTGALISIEQGHSLSDFIKTGTPMNSVVSSELLCSIFQYGTPLHDGAVIIQGVKIACAAAYFPPTTRELPTSYGARHRAAVGISEITDSITIIVSEETGNISIAENGKLTVISENSLHDFLMNIVCDQQVTSVKDKKDTESDKDAAKESMYVDGKKPGVFAHYFKGKTRRTKTDLDPVEKKYTKRKKGTDHEALEKKEVSIDMAYEKMEIEDLTQKQDAGFDAFFDNIVTETKEEMPPVEKPKKRGRKPKEKAVVEQDDREEKKVEKKPKSKSTTAKKKAKEKPVSKANTSVTSMASDLFDDVIEPETIILHYEKADEEDTSEKKEGSDS